MTLSPIMLAPAITYGNGTSAYYNTNAATNSVTGGSIYRVERWMDTTDTTTTSNTYPNWDMASTIIQFRTLDMPTTLQYTQGPGYTIRYQNGETDTTACWTYGSVVYAPPKSAAERLREILNSRMAPGILTSCRPLGYTEDVREIRARDTLRRVLGEDRFRDFVRRGSVSVRAKSGLVYQIFPGSDFTKVYDSGKLIERLCVVLLGGFPPTDSLIMRYLMILNNEKQFRGYAIRHGIQTPYLPVAPDQRSLTEIFKELKKAA